MLVAARCGLHARVVAANYPSASQPAIMAANPRKTAEPPASLNVMQNRKSASAGAVDFPERELIRRGRRGDIAAYEEIFDRYRRRVYNLVYRMVANESDAADLTQEVFVKVFTTLPSLKSERAFPAWLRTVATNTVLDHLRRRPNVPSESLDERTILGDDQSVEREIPSWSDNPERATETKTLQEAVQRAISSLEDDHRIVVVLHHIEGLDVQQIAKMLRVPEGTVKSRLARAREHLKRKLGGFVET